MDVTERLAAAEALRLKDEQLRQAQKMEALGRLTSGIAHDFNNLLTSILGYSHLLLHRPALDDAVRGDIEEIVRAGQRAEEMIGRLLAFSHSPSQSVEPVAINEVIEGVEKLLRRALGEDIELILDLDATIEPILADTGQLEEVLMNLAVNARDAMPAGGRLTIAAGRVELDDEFCRGRAGLKPGVYMRIEVADTGCGMTPEVRERVRQRHGPRTVHRLWQRPRLRRLHRGRKFVRPRRPVPNVFPAGRCQRSAGTDAGSCPRSRRYRDHPAG